MPGHDPSLAMSKDAVTGAIASLLVDPKYSDLQIRCDGQIFPVHRAVVCSMSKILAKECDGAFKESKDRIIEHNIFSASTLRAMIQFMYTGSYDWEVAEAASAAAIDGISSSRIDACTEDSAMDYDAKVDEGPTPSDTPDETSPDAAALLSPLDADNDQLVVPMMTLYTRNAIAHINIYAIADYYDVSSLKSVALEKSFDSFGNVDHNEFVHVVRAVYSNTVNRDDSLRKSIVKEAVQRSEWLLNDKQLIAAIAEEPEFQHFAADLLPACQASDASLRAELVVTQNERDEAKQQAAHQLGLCEQSEGLTRKAVTLTASITQCRNCGIGFGGYLDSADMIRCRGCRCKHYG